jgi:circadian clock protein KaiC
MSKTPARPEPAATGINGLDDILAGGFRRNRLYLIEGAPGAGKTTLAMQFLLTGAAAGETVLYVTLSETQEELREVAASHDWALDGIAFRELAPSEAELEPDAHSTMFHASEIELAATTARVLEDVERLKPTRVVFDSLSEMRLLAGSALRYRRQILALKQFFVNRQCTVLLLDDLTATDQDLQMRSIAHGVLLLEQTQPPYGAQRRRLQVLKYRGVRFRGGYHDYAIVKGGLQVFPRLVAAEHRQASTRTQLSSDVRALDALLGGGIEEGSSTLLIGPPGTGKSTLAAQFAWAAARRGQKSALFLFDENPQTLLTRCRELQIDLEPFMTRGLVAVTPVDPAELTPGEFTHAIAAQVDQGAKIVVIDSLNGYLNAMPDEGFLTVHLHELLMYLSQRGVAAILISAQQGLIGAQMAAPVDASYLADAVVMLRFFEARGEMRQALSVVKKRSGRHERTIREFAFEPGGITVGPPLREYRGVLTGVPGIEPDPGSST